MTVSLPDTRARLPDCSIMPPPSARARKPASRAAFPFPTCWKAVSVSERRAETTCCVPLGPLLRRTPATSTRPQLTHSECVVMQCAMYAQVRAELVGILMLTGSICADAVAPNVQARVAAPRRQQAVQHACARGLPRVMRMHACACVAVGVWRRRFVHACCVLQHTEHACGRARARTI